ncbi:ATP-binding protein [Microtetraspora malaysiensis]|uniref:ATP-binding protein n=1 Tax=Microtetraspora malaysiensis TaxID=161358 RepID=UPI003D905FD5
MAPCLPRPLGLAEFAGRAESVGKARGWARGLLAEEVADDVLDDAVVLLSELITNSVVHSDSGRKSDGLVTVFLAAGDGGAYCEVIDDGSATSVPTVRGHRMTATATGAYGWSTQWRTPAASITTTRWETRSGSG